MKKNILWMLAAVAFMCMALTSCTKDDDNIVDNIDNGDDASKEPSPAEPKSEYNIFVMSDIHVMAPELLVQKGTAFENYTKVDPKLLEESGEVLETVVDVVLGKKPDLVLICLDSNLYEENQYVERGAKSNLNQTAGRLREGTLEWMWKQADAARAAGKQVVAMMHHNAVEHYDGQAIVQSPYVVRDYKKVAEGMMEHGIHLVLTGHQHLQDIAQYRKVTEAKTDSLIDISTGATVSYPNVWRTITVNLDFTRWNVSTGYIKSIPSIADVQQECYKRSSTNIAAGLAWHVNDYWPTIQSYSTVLWLLGLSKLVPDTPQKATDLLMEFLSKPFTEAYMIHNAGNENETPVVWLSSKSLRMA